MTEMPQRRVGGSHDIRMDGMCDLIMRAKGASVLDIGCNRGLVAFEFANNGATKVHGCDNYEAGIRTAREIFADLRNCKSKFECVDLTSPNAMQNAFGDQKYQIVLMLATYHKLKRIMGASQLAMLMADIANRTVKYFAWRGTSRDKESNDAELATLDKALHEFKRIHYSEISEELGAAAIWQRQ